MENNTPPTTFWKLLTDYRYKIEIPTIQRDYVQGSAEAEKNQIPNKFVENLYNALKENKQLSLEFIYGYTENIDIKKDTDRKILLPEYMILIKERRTEDNEQKLILLDGQQRITTLFLLHFYLSVANLPQNLSEKKFKNYWKKTMAPLGNFTYATRSNTRDFCRYLIDKERKYKIKKTDTKLSEQIKQQSWFNFPEEDPTISSMLNMLDIIQEKFNGENFIDKLTGKNCPITFNFLESKELGCQEDLYLKMNARGKQLTRYEIFKSRLTNWIPEGYEQFIEDLDNQYQNILFWDPKSKDPIKDMDDRQYNFFTHITWLLDEDNRDNKKEEEIQEISEFYLLNNAEKVYKYKPEDKLVNILSLRAVLEGFYQFKKTYTKKDNEIDKKIDNTFISIINPDATYYDRLKLYSLLLFFKDVFKNEEDFSDKTTRKWKETDLTQWFRICHNLIENTLTDDPESFRSALISLRDLWTEYLKYKQKFYWDFYDYFKTTEVKYFDEKQQEEEKLKIEIIKNIKEELTEQDLISHESHPYLKSKIGFILKYSSYKDANNNQKHDKNKFEEYYKKLCILFQPTSNENPEKNIHHLFRKALLTKGSPKENYLVPIKHRFSFCNFAANPRYKGETWDKVFDSAKKSPILKTLLDDPLLKEVTEAELKKICENYTNNFNEQKDFYTDWRYLFIKSDKDFFNKLNPIPNWAWPELRIGNNIFFQGPKASGDWSNKGEIYTYAFIKWCENNNKPEWKYEISSNPYAYCEKEKNRTAYQFRLRYDGTNFKLSYLKDGDKEEASVTNTTIKPLFTQLYNDIDKEIQKIIK